MPQPNRDRITETLVGPQTLGQRFNDIGDAIQSVIAGRSTFGEAMNASRAARLREALAVEQVKNSRTRLDLEKRKFQTDLQSRIVDLDREASKSRNNAIRDVWKDTLGPVVKELAKNDPNRVSKILTDFHSRAKGLDEDAVDYPTLQGIAATVLRGHDLAIPDKTDERKAQSPVGKILADIESAKKNNDTEAIEALKTSLHSEVGGDSADRKFLLAMRALGQDVTDKQINRLSPEDAGKVLSNITGRGITVTTPEGTTIQIGGSGTGAMGKPPATRVDDIRENIQQAQSGKSMVQSMIASITENPERAGIVGSLKSSIQKGLGVLTDLDKAFGFDLSGFVKKTMRALKVDVDAERAAPEAAVFFDPSLPEMEVLENALAYRLARANKGGGRLNQQDITTWKNIIQLRGVTDVNSVMARLRVIEGLFEAAEQQQNERLKLLEGGTFDSPQSVESMSDEELMKFLNENLQ